jgi:hypothetical protein
MRMGNKNMEVVVVDPIEKFANTLGIHQDSTCLRGKLLVSVNASTLTPVNVLTLSPSFLGLRASSMSSIFTDFRFKKLVMKYNYGAATGLNAVGVFGILDDASGAEGDAPTSAAGLLEYRTSAINYNNQAPTVVEWRPTNTKLWYKCSGGASGSDPRLVNSGVMFVCNQASTISTHFVEIDYSIVFKGAQDTASTVFHIPDPSDEHDAVQVHHLPMVSLPRAVTSQPRR